MSEDYSQLPCSVQKDIANLELASEVSHLIGYVSACPWKVTEDYMDGLCDKLNRVSERLGLTLRYERCDDGIRTVVDANKKPGGMKWKTGKMSQRSDW